MNGLKDFLANNDAALWALAFVGVCVLVGLGKMEAKTVELMVMAIVGRAGAGVLDRKKKSGAE
jgi:hypothetical protein